MGLSLDGSANAHDLVSSGTAAASLTTSNSNDIIVATGFAVATGALTASCADLHSSLSFTQRVSHYSSGSGLYFFSFWAVANSPVSPSDTITVTVTSGAGTYSGNMTISVWGVSGANISSPFDGSPSISDAGLPSITTSIPNDFIFGAISFSGGSGAVDPPWTGIANQTNVPLFVAEYQIVSATQSGLSANVNGGTAHGGYLDAITENFGDFVSLPSAIAKMKTTQNNQLILYRHNSDTLSPSPPENTFVMPRRRTYWGGGGFPV